MAQHDYEIANQTFPSFRSDLNSVLEAINTSNSGTSRPSSAVAGTIWLDTTNATNPTLKLYDGADDISLATFDYSANTVNWIDSTVVFDIVNDTTPQLGGNLDVNGNSLVSTSNGNITFTPDGTGKVVISGLSFPTTDGTCGQAIVTDGCGNLSFASIEGRTGTVNWDTTAKTANFTAVSGNGYFVNTTGGAITATLPATPSAGDIVAFNDYARNFQTNNLTLARNGSNIQGASSDAIIGTNGQSSMFVYVDATKGWIPVEDQTTATYGASYISATGGTVTCCGDYKIHTFTSPGTFTVTCAGNAGGSNTVDYLVIAGGGGGASGSGSEGGGAGGAGGYRESSGTASGCYSVSPLGACVSALPVTATGYPITVGAGGAGGSGVSVPEECGSQGSNSIFSSITSTGGGYGGRGHSPCSPTPGGSGGSGGGGGTYNGGAGSGNTPPVSPPQGNPGGTGAPAYAGGGGGGATTSGGNATQPQAGSGGSGATSSINATPTTRAGGGGGGTHPAGNPGSGGSGGGGAGWPPVGVSGTTNTGSGGGGGGGTPTNSGGSGGSGIVIIRYKYQ